MVSPAEAMPLPRGSRVAVAVSGGVDSLCALWQLQQCGCTVLALHGRFLEVRPEADPVPGLEKACRHLGIALHVVDLRQQFEAQVLQSFATAYAQGRTPNPCAHCNRDIKFGALLDAALALGAERLATGHYARLCAAPAGAAVPFVLGTAQDRAKDQSYFLSLVPAERLQRAFFPLARQDKAASVRMVQEAGLEVPLPRESQDICFVPSSQAAYRPFLQAQWQRWGLAPAGEGPVLLAQSRDLAQWRDWPEIARHRGLWQYTEGQRKGLGIAWSEPLYVLHKLQEHNVLVVGPASLLGMRSCCTEQANIFVPVSCWPQDVWVRLRYRQQALPAVAELVDGCLHISLQQTQQPTAPGQVAAVYDAQGRVLAAGLIRSIA